MDKTINSLDKIIKKYKAETDNTKRIQHMRKILYILMMDSIKRDITKYRNRIDYGEILSIYFRDIQCVQQLAGTLTPRQFSQIFPINKKYDGDRWQSIDYFYTVKYIENSIGWDNNIGDNVLEFFMEYDNRFVRKFVISCMKIIDEINRMDGRSSIIEQAFPGIKTYNTDGTLYKQESYTIDDINSIFDDIEVEDV